MRFNTQSGQISKILLIVAAILLVVIVVVFFIIRFLSSRELRPLPVDGEIEPVYEVQVGDVEFIFISAVDMGNTLLASQSQQNFGLGSGGNDLTTTERFIKVTIGAKNKGTVNTNQDDWRIGNIIDSEGRNFIESRDAAPWASSPGASLITPYQLTPCGSILKPEFEHTPCVKIYEVARVSRDLKIEVFYKRNKELLDLIITR